jgi:hypothetical protein
MPATPDALGALAVVLGLGVGLGLWSVLATWWGVSDSGAEARVSSPMLRIAHALRDVSAPARAELAPWHIDPVSVGGVIISPAITRLTNGLHLLLGGDAVANRLVEQAGVDYGPEEYRLRRVLWALAGAARPAGHRARNTGWPGGERCGTVGTRDWWGDRRWSV